jgi:hypothetical protein
MIGQSYLKGTLSDRDFNESLCAQKVKPVLQATVYTCVGASRSPIGTRSLLGTIGGSIIYSILSESLWAQCLTKMPAICTGIAV